MHTNFTVTMTLPSNKNKKLLNKMEINGTNKIISSFLRELQTMKKLKDTQDKITS